MPQTTNTYSVKFGHSNVNYGCVDCGNIIGSFNNIAMFEEDAQVMHWLTLLEPDNRYDGVCTTRFEGVGDWLLERSEFREWREVRLKPIRLSCSAKEIREWARPI